MLRHGTRLLVAILTFNIGVTIVWTLQLIPRLEAALVDHFFSIDNSDLRPVGLVALDSDEDANEIYRLIVHRKFTFNAEVKLIVLQSETTGCPMYEDESKRKEWGRNETFHQMRLCLKSRTEAPIGAEIR